VWSEWQIQGLFQHFKPVDANDLGLFWPGINRCIVYCNDITINLSLYFREERICPSVQLVGNLSAINLRTDIWHDDSNDDFSGPKNYSLGHQIHCNPDQAWYIYNSWNNFFVWVWLLCLDSWILRQQISNFRRAGRGMAMIRSMGFSTAIGSTDPISTSYLLGRGGDVNDRWRILLKINGFLFGRQDCGSPGSSLYAVFWAFLPLQCYAASGFPLQ